jgi:flagellar biosynthesis protein FlhG
MEPSDLPRKTPLTCCISSGKGGVGKTTLAVNLSYALARRKIRVLLIDGDLGLANVDVVLGINASRTIRETVEHGIDPSELLVDIAPGLTILPASSGIPQMACLTTAEQAALTSSLEGLFARFDVVMVDTAAGIGESVLWFNQWCSMNCLVITPDPTSLTDAYALIKVLAARLPERSFHLMVNCVKNSREGEEIFLHLRGVLKNFLNREVQCLGILPQDRTAVQAIRKRKPVLQLAPEAKISKALVEIAATIMASQKIMPLSRV